MSLMALGRCEKGQEDTGKIAKVVEKIRRGRS